MKLISLRLVGYKRFALNNIREFRLDPTEREQLVLGTNGSGKSSLLNEISPLPPESSEYTKDGSKTTVWSHNGAVYILTSTFEGGNKHSFKKNGDELNPGGTGSAQKTLVWQEFRYSQDVHNLVTGKEKFTDMSPARRREWFTRLSDVDYSYAIEVFNRIKERVRDTSGALKLTKKRLVNESSACIGAEEEQMLREEYSALNEVVEVMLRKRHPFSESELASTNQSLKNKHVRLAEISRQIENIQPVIQISSKYKSVQDIDTVLSDINSTLTALETEIAIVSEEDEKIQKSIDLLRSADASDITELNRKIGEIDAEIKEYKDARRTGLVIVDSIPELSAFLSVKEILKEIFENIPNNSERKFTGETYERIKAELFALKERRHVIDAAINGISAKLSHAEEHAKLGNVKCPKCAHSFLPSAVVDKAAAEDKLRAGGEEKKTIDKKIEDLEQSLTEFDQYRKHYGDFIRCFRNNQTLSNLNTFIFEGKYLTDSPRRFLPVLEDVAFDYEIEQHVASLERKRVALIDLISRASEMSGTTLAGLEEKSKELHERLCSCVERRTATQRNKAEIQEERRLITKLISNVDEMRELVCGIEKDISENIKHTSKKLYSELVAGLQTISANKARAIGNIDQQKSIIADLEKSIVRMEVEEEAAKILMSELSPTEGLIAEGLLNFIRVFTAQMNFLIRKIWSYPLQVMECGSSDESGAELNYKFPLMVQSKDNVKSDVKDGSTAMQEIVNLVFRVTAMNYMGLSDGILSLDEFGASFDEVHRSSASEMVKSLLEQQNFSQLFMVSHYLASYGSFQNAEVCVLCSSNITVPTNNFNKHVKIIS